MNQDLVDLLRKLSATDSKTLSQKALKAGEEYGEMARAVLPFESAFATTHRFVEKQDILEECADLVTCALDVAFSIGFTMDDFEDMLAKKAKKWAEMQARDRRAKWPVPFEIHVTINEAAIDAFKGACAALGVKPLLIAMQDGAGSTIMNDLQTSSIHMGTNSTAYAEMERIRDGMTTAGFNVVRCKIEAAPWHPAAPTMDDAESVMPKDCYFESHFAIVCDADDVDNVRARCTSMDLRLSKNVFKRYDDGRVKVLATLRRDDKVREVFESMVATAYDSLCELSSYIGPHVSVEKPIIEFSVFDTRVSHDAAWMKQDAK